METGSTTHRKRKADQKLPQIISAQLQLAGTTILVSDHSDDYAPVGTRLSLLRDQRRRCCSIQGHCRRSYLRGRRDHRV
ncbi:hypothetical protein LINGRAHAP2_LOCUS7813 [Linum grandiflorum]